jgi:hypothetical protein
MNSNSFFYKKIFFKTENYFPIFLLKFLINIYFNLFIKKRLSSNLSLLKNSKRGKRGFLLATGPSVNKENLKILKNEDCFSLSNFHLHKDINIINPLFHFIAPYHKPVNYKAHIKWLKVIDLTLPPNTQIVLSEKDRELVFKEKIFTNRHVYYLFFSKYIDLKKELDLTKPLPHLQSSFLMILPFMIYMGYKKIYLLGCDFDRLKSYGEVTKDFFSLNKDYKKKKDSRNVWHWSFDLVQELQNHINVLNLLKLYFNYAIRKNIKIINLSKNSWIDLFPKKKLKEII